MKHTSIAKLAIFVAALTALRAHAAETPSASPAVSEPAAQASPAAAPAQAQAAPKPEKAAPLPLLTLDGVGGVVLTPIAYLLNPGAEGTKVGLPSVGATFVNARQKDVESIGFTETLYGRVELGYNASRFGTGTLQSDILQYAGANIGRNNVWLHSFNARAAVIKEGDFGQKWLPAITAGVHGKINDGINEIDQSLGGILRGVGYDRDYGVEFTLVGSKTFVIEGHPVILSVAGRASDASNLGYLGYSGRYEFSVEGNIVVGLTDWLFLAFEYRQKINQYDEIAAGGKTLVGEEGDWWTVGLAAVVSPHLTLTAGYGHLGQVLNTVENTAWAAAIKYEF